MTTAQTLQPQELAATFAALGDPRRIQIVSRLLEEQPLSISALCKGTDVSRQAITKHLRTLANAQLVTAEKTGRETRYSLELRRLENANAFLNSVAEKWDQALERLKSQLE